MDGGEFLAITLLLLKIFIGRMIESSGRDQPQHTKEREKRVRDPFDELDDTNSGEVCGSQYLS